MQMQMKVKTLIVKKIGDDGPYAFEADSPDLSGAPFVGRGATEREALGDWLLNNQKVTEITINVNETEE